MVLGKRKQVFFSLLSSAMVLSHFCHLSKCPNMHLKLHFYPFSCLLCTPCNVFSHLVLTLRKFLTSVYLFLHASQQVVFLQRVKGSAANSSLASDSKTTQGLSSADIENASVVDVGVSEKEAEKVDEKSIDFEEIAEEGVRSVINFLKDKIPELKVKVMKINVAEELTEAGDVKQLMEEDSDDAISSENSEEEGSDLDDMQPDQVAAGENDDTAEEGKDLDTKLFIGGVLHNKEDNPTRDEYIRIPAEIKDMEKDSFMLHIPKRYQDNSNEENIASKVKLASVAAQDVSKLMPPDVAKAFWSSDKVSSKVRTGKYLT